MVAVSEWVVLMVGPFVVIAFVVVAAAVIVMRARRRWLRRMTQTPTPHPQWEIPHADARDADRRPGAARGGYGRGPAREGGPR